MRNSLLLAAVLALLPVTGWAQTPPTCGPQSGLQWNLNPEADMAVYRVYAMPTPLSVEVGVSPVALEVVHDLAAVITLPDGSNVLQGGLAVVNDGLNYFSVTAVDTSGNESTPSNEVVCLVQLPPTTPMGVVIIQMVAP